MYHDAFRPLVTLIHKILGRGEGRLAVALNGELETTLGVVPSGIPIPPGSLHKLPRCNIALSVPYHCVNAVEVDEGIGGGAVAGVRFHVEADLRDHLLKEFLDVHDETSP